MTTDTKHQAIYETTEEYGITGYGELSDQELDQINGGLFKNWDKEKFFKTLKDIAVVLSVVGAGAKVYNEVKKF